MLKDKLIVLACVWNEKKKGKKSCNRHRNSKHRAELKIYCTILTSSARLPLTFYICPLFDLFTVSFFLGGRVETGSDLNERSQHRNKGFSAFPSAPLW